MKQSLDDENAALSAQADNLNKLYEEYTDLESKMLQWQADGFTEQFNANYDKYESLIKEYNDEYDDYNAKLAKHNENVDKYNALIGVK